MTGFESLPSSLAPHEPRFRELTRQLRLNSPVFVTRPTMPSLAAYTEKLETIWESRWLTNCGPLHQELESRLADYLGVRHLSLVCNATIGLMVALQALRITSGEVVTTPFTFPATPHSLFWNRITPVFSDIDSRTFNLDPARLERFIGAETRAILAVHCFGVPCEVEAIQEVADRHGLRVIYDAAHVFGVRREGESLLNWGDMSVLSFHATKLYSTVEGGAIVSSTAEQKERVDWLKNFGIADEETVVGPGINGKLNEFQAAYGLLALDSIESEINQRAHVAEEYRAGLAEIPGLSLPSEAAGTRPNHAYFPILVDAAEFGLTRDELSAALREFNVFPRKYFFPLCSHYPCYQAHASSDSGSLPNAERVADAVLCLPIYGELEPATVRRIVEIIAALHALARKPRGAALYAD